MREKIDRTGEIHITNEGYPVKIIDGTNRKKCIIQFENGHIKYDINYSNIIAGKVSNPYHPSVYKTGYEGFGKYTFLNSPRIKVLWDSIFARCFNNKKNPSYVDCNISEEWHNFQNFAKWYEQNWKPHMTGWHLDKDVLIRGNKLYSSNSCCFIPLEINCVFVVPPNRDLPQGVYVSGKKYRAKFGKDYNEYFDILEDAVSAYNEQREKHIKKLADEWKPLIEPEVYQAMYNYTVDYENI